MRVLCYAQTNIGSGRDNNEDNYYCNGTFKRDAAVPVAEAAAEQEGKRLIYGVFDGMGGEANGEQAALLCAQTLHRCSSDEPFDALDFFRRANVAVCDMIAASGQVSGSTAATVHLTGNHAYCCNVGDSRIYLQRGGALQRISRDHTKYQERLDAGAAGDADDADDSPDRHVLTQYLGMLGARQRLMPYFAAGVPLAVGDRLLLCTDGLTGKLSDSRLQAALGAEIDVPTLDGSVKYTIPEGTQTDTEFRIRGKGIQQLGSNNKGDLIFKVRVETPRRLTEKQRELLRQFDGDDNGKQYDQRKTFIDKVKELFDK